MHPLWFVGLPTRRAHAETQGKGEPVSRAGRRTALRIGLTMEPSAMCLPSSSEDARDLTPSLLPSSSGMPASPATRACTSSCDRPSATSRGRRRWVPPFHFTGSVSQLHLAKYQIHGDSTAKVTHRRAMMSKGTSMKKEKKKPKKKSSWTTPAHHRGGLFCCPTRPWCHRWR